MMNYTTMIIIMIVSGLLSSMYIWSDKMSDVRISINDAYMIGIMTSWMCFFMAAFHKDMFVILISTGFIVLFYYVIRNQTYVSKQNYYKGMIPHHSMAVTMSKKLLENDKTLTKSDKEFINNIIITQENEIDWMKHRE